ncbi:MAG TPA: sigma-54 dependent transcriptional regulator, partial [Vicinamibacteria bacterium]|nr:sigma-54 dependent transcriptional regulator [Vicinamibacteria bacterium]
MTRPQDKVLIVEDERAQRDALAQYLGRAGYAVTAVAGGEEALELLARGSFSVLITDLRLPGMDGLGVVRRAHELDEELGLLLMTAYASVESAVEALRVGAHDYLLKPLILEEVARKVSGLLEHRALVRENARLRRALQDRSGTAEVVASSAAMKDVMAWARRAANSKANVLITGETGTGKEVVARAIHSLGADREQPFLAVNLAAVPENMVESELFGHERGAFTGATALKPGRFERADGGTLLLDEVGELPPGVQAKLLRVLQEGSFEPLGTNASSSVDVRIISATHRNLKERVAEGRFREDLYYRLKVLDVAISPLRDRRA